MNELLCTLLAMILSAAPLEEVQTQTVAFSRLPAGCAAEYDPFLRRERRAVSTEVIRTDLDGDGTPEMIIWTGHNGSAGEEWSVMRKRGADYVKIGQVFGRLHRVSAPHHGLLVSCPVGWDEAHWSFYRVAANRLQKMVELEIRYSRPIRENPVEIKISLTEVENAVCP